jgi:glutamate-ammonia-ligase adenylyltransferase
LLDPASSAELREAYNFFRTVEARLRIVHNRSGCDLPEDPDELDRLARRLNYDETHPDASVEAFRADAVNHAARVRALFQDIVGKAAGEAVATICPP